MYHTYTFYSRTIWLRCTDRWCAEAVVIRSKFNPLIGMRFTTRC